MKITKDKNNLILTVPLKTNRYNPYSDEVVGTMNNIIGVVEEEANWYKYYIANRIDMSYKNKGDQVGFPIIMFVDKEELEEICKDLQIDIFYL